MAPPTARQVEYAIALGVEIPWQCDKDRISSLIDAGVQTLGDPPNAKQLELAKNFGIPISAEVLISRDLVDLIYDHLKARRWVYSVIRHIVKADWKSYSESGLPDKYANQIASALKQDQKLMAQIERRDGGNHASGGDVWYRITEKGVNSAEYLFVKNYDLPDHILKLINVGHLSTTAAKRPRKTSKAPKTGCLVALLLLCTTFVVVLVK